MPATSSVDALFGNVDNEKLESNVNKLFASSSGPIDNLKVKNQHKTRTVLPSLKRKTNDNESKKTEKPETQKQEEEPALKKQKKQKKKADADANEDLEGNYYAKLMDSDEKDEDTKEIKEDSEKEFVSTPEQVAKKTDLKEEELEKAERTVFIGNLTSDVITSKALYKSFKKLFSTDPNPTADDNEEEKSDDDKKNLFTIESIRFRSISFDEALPRKVAFVQQKLHKSRDSVNAYIVYKNKQAVNIISSKLNGNVFHNHHLRVDSVAHPAPHDKKRSIFVGNLDFEEDEENLWNHFKSCGEIEYVRIIRDPKTNMGKGFAYVQFKELESVNKALLLNEKQMTKIKTDKDNKKKGRKLRVTRCKNMRKSNNTVSNIKNNNKLSESQRTKVGRAQKVLGKADRATLGQELTIEGQRASKGEGATHLKKKKARSKTGRVTKRSIAFKKANKK